eukprot:5118497-Pleurochrysis_carterae.AAC.1
MMLILGARGAFMVDRNFTFRRLPPMHFPRRDAPAGEHAAAVAAPAAMVDGTLLDGELVLDEAVDEMGKTAAPIMRYLAYDACCVLGRTLMNDALPMRLMHLRREVLTPRYRAKCDGYNFAGALPLPSLRPV